MVTYNKENLLRHTDELVPADFIRLGNEPYYTKRLSDRELRMYFSVNQYYPHSAVIRAISVDVYIDAIETIFDEVLRENPINDLDPNQKKDTIGGGGANIPGVDRDLLNQLDVEDDTTFAIVRPELEKIVQGALQFYDDFSSLQAIHDHVETLSGRAKGNFLRQPLASRLMILKKLINASDYESYSQSIVNFYVSENNTERADFNLALKTRLDNL